MRIIICDDDEKDAELCKNALEKLSRKYNVDTKIMIVGSGQALLFCINTKFAKADLIYLDLHMPIMDGIATAKNLRKKNIVADIVFYTVDGSRAIEGYDVDAMHYMVKGQTSAAKFEEVFLKAKEHADRREVETIALSCAGEYRNISIKDILYFKVQDHIITVHYRGIGRESTFEFYSTLSKIEEHLCDAGLVRIHNSYLVAEKFIAKKTQRQVELVNGEVIPVGRSYRNKIKLQIQDCFSVSDTVLR